MARAKLPRRQGQTLSTWKARIKRTQGFIETALNGEYTNVFLLRQMRETEERYEKIIESFDEYDPNDPTPN